MDSNVNPSELTAKFYGLLPDTTYEVCVVSIVGQGDLTQQSDATCTDAPTGKCEKNVVVAVTELDLNIALLD